MFSHCNYNLVNSVEGIENIMINENESNKKQSNKIELVYVSEIEVVLDYVPSRS